MFVLAALFALLFAALVGWEAFQFKNASAFCTNAGTDSRRAFATLFHLENAQLNEFTYDYGQWDDMVRFANKPDLSWAGYSLRPQLENYTIDGIWIYDRTGRLIYYTHKAGVDPQLRSPLSPAAFAEIAARKDHFLFYAPGRRSLVQVSAATIRPRWDIAARTAPAGYVLAARAFSRGYVSELAPTQAGSVAIEPRGSTARRGGGGDPSFREKLCDWRGQSVGVLSFREDSAYLDFLRQSYEKSICFVAAIAIATLAIAFFVIVRWISEPLKTISGSMLSHDTSPLKRLGRSRTEFGQLAALVSDFFAQKERLESEIGRRKRIEGDLRTAQEQLEKRVADRTAELSEANDALNLEINRRIHSEAALREAQEQYRSIVDNAAEGIFQVTPEGVYLSSNIALARMLGYASPEDLKEHARDIGGTIYVDRELRQRFREQVEQNGAVQGFEAEIYRRDGSVTWISENARTVRDKGGNVLYYEGTLEDISERKRSEREIFRLNAHLAARLGRIEALRRIDQAINTNHELNAILRVLLKEVREQLGVDGAAVLLIDEETGRLRYTSASGVQMMNIHYASACADRGLAGKAVASARNVFVENVARDPEASDALAHFIGESIGAYYALPLISRGRVKGVIEVLNHAAITPDIEWCDFLEALAGQAAIAVENTTLFEGLQRTNIELGVAYDATIEGWSRALDLRDKETEGHSQRVTEMTVRLAADLGICGEELLHVRRGALLHDIGKMGIPDQILLKPGPLSDEEWVVMRMHPVFAYEMLSPIDFLVPALEIPHCHHEKWDGSGYPQGLSGEQIPLSARIFAVVDVWDALRSDRPYRPGWPVSRIREYIVGQSGKHFDPMVVDAFLRVLDEHMPLDERALAAEQRLAA